MICTAAIGKEEEAATLYNDLAGKINQQAMKNIFLGFAKEEMGHKEKLLAIKAGKLLLRVTEKVKDLKIAEDLADVPNADTLTYQQALTVAMKNEKAAFKLYNDLAEAADDYELKATLLGLANEEAKHKLRFEIEYDDVILRDN